MRQVFISYSSKEANQANEIVATLEKQGIKCWIAPRDIRVGSNYTKDIPRAIDECPCFLLVLSRESQKSKWVNKELTRAINQDKRIMPLMIESFSVNESFEFLLEDVQTRPYHQTKKQTMQEVMAEIHTLMQYRSGSTETSNISFPPIGALTQVPVFHKQDQVIVDTRYENHPELNMPYFEMDATNTIRIPFAVDQENTIQYFEVGGNSSSHALLVGSSGSGKSVALHTMILQTIKHYHPDDVEVWALDYKGVEFNRYNRNRPPHYRAITSDVSKRLTLKHLIDFLMAKYELRTEAFRRMCVCNICQYREKCGDHFMPRILVLIDECDLLFWELREKYGNDYLNKFETLLRVSGAVGFSFIFSSQTPVITELSLAVRSLITTHLYFRCNSSTLRSILADCDDVEITIEDILSLHSGQCIYKKPVGNMHHIDGLEATQNLRVNILCINSSTADEIIQQSKELIGVNYAPKSDIML